MAETMESSPMAADLQTLASPDPASASTDKKKSDRREAIAEAMAVAAAARSAFKKRKAMEDSSTPTPKKKKKPKKSKSSDGAPASTEKEKKSIDGALAPASTEKEKKAIAAAPAPASTEKEKEAIAAAPGSTEKEKKAIDDAPAIAAAAKDEYEKRKASTMEDSSTPTPKKKKKKKKKKNKPKKSKAIDDAPAPASEMEEQKPEESMDIDDAPASTEKKKKKKKKKNKKNKDIDSAPVSTEKNKPKKYKSAIIEAAHAARESSKKRNEKGKGKCKGQATADETETINVTVDASLAGGSAAPVVGYFPSGYNPLNDARKTPRARLFRNTKHPSWVDLVVQPPGGGPEFVGSSYKGEGSLPQLCNYALGVLDKATGTLKIVPIAGDKILRLEPHIEVQKPAQSQHSGVTQEAGSAVETGEMKVQDLTDRYGAKKDKDTDKKWKSLIEQRNDPSAYEDLDLGEPSNVNVSDDAPVIVRNIPPYDPTADTSETAYLFDEIIPKSIRSHLLEILGHLESGEFSSKGYGRFVSNRTHKLEKLEGEDKERLACILSYITHLLTFLERNNLSKRHRKEAQPSKTPTVPHAVHRNLMVMFMEEGSSALSTEKKELLINYILVLTLFADDFRSDPTDILADLKMARPMLKPYYDQLGCKAVSKGAFQSTLMTLPAPLKFPKEVTRRKRQRG